MKRPRRLWGHHWFLGAPESAQSSFLTTEGGSVNQGSPFFVSFSIILTAEGAAVLSPTRPRCGLPLGSPNQTTRVHFLVTAAVQASRRPYEVPVLKATVLPSAPASP